MFLFKITTKEPSNDNIPHYVTITVKAESKEEALKKAKNIYSEGIEYSIFEVREILYHGR